MAKFPERQNFSLKLNLTKISNKITAYLPTYSLHVRKMCHMKPWQFK